MIVLPKSLQLYDHDCARAVRIQLCLYYQVTPSPVDLSDPLYGTDPVTLQAWLRHDGFSILAGKTKIEDVKYFTSKGWPVTTLTNLYGGHYVNITGFWRHFIYFYDPAEGERRLRLTEWQLLWADSNRFNREYSNYVIIARP